MSLGASSRSAFGSWQSGSLEARRGFPSHARQHPPHLDRVLGQINLPFTGMFYLRKPLEETEIKNSLLGRHARNVNLLHM